MIKEIIFDWEGVLSINGSLNWEIFNWIKNNSQYSFSILTNSNLSLMESLDSSEIKKLFNLIITPKNSQLFKPDEKVFLFTIEKTGKKPNEIIFIDDNLINVKSAQKTEINGYLYQNNYDLINFLEGI